MSHDGCKIGWKQTSALDQILVCKKHKEETVSQTVYIDYTDDESFDVRIGDNIIIHANHDEDGWSGMERIRGAVVELCNTFGIPVLEVGDPNV